MSLSGDVRRISMHLVNFQTFSGPPRTIPTKRIQEVGDEFIRALGDSLSGPSPAPPLPTKRSRGGADNA